MNTLQNNNTEQPDLSRRFFLGASVALATSALVGCESSEFQTKTKKSLKPRNIQASRLSNSTQVLRKLENVYLYLLQDKQSKQIPSNAIWKFAKNQDLELSAQMGQSYEDMGQECMLLFGRIEDKDFKIYFDIQSASILSEISDISPDELNEILSIFFTKKS